MVFAKLGAADRRRQARPAPPAPAPPPTPVEEGPRGVSPLGLLGGSLALGLLVWLGLGMLRPAPAPGAGAGAAAPGPTAVRPDGPGPAAEAPLPVLPPRPSPEAEPSAAPLTDASGLTEHDATRANELVDRLNARRRAQESDLPVAEELFARYPQQAQLGDLLENVLLSLASQQREQRRYAEAQERLRRAINLRPRSVPARALLVSLLTGINDFTGAEAAAREALAVDARNAELWYALAYVLFRQDRNREALEAAQASLAIQESEQARALLASLQKTKQDEGRMKEQQLSHFHVRYDGEAHEDVGREILRALERHYATLVRALDHEPSTAIPVILFSREQYVEAAGAPVWSGGVYDSVDGRIRIPIGGLSKSLSPHLDQTLIHELVHAFLEDKTRGAIQHASPVNEGFAQYMEGHRAGPDLSGPKLAWLIEALPATYPQQCASLTCVHGFYLGGLSFVEYLIGIRGLGGMNDLFRAMAETGSVDEAFRRVYGQDYAAARHAWRARLDR